MKCYWKASIFSVERLFLVNWIFAIVVWPRISWRIPYTLNRIWNISCEHARNGSISVYFCRVRLIYSAFIFWPKFLVYMEWNTLSLLPMVSYDPKQPSALSVWIYSIKPSVNRSDFEYSFSHFYISSTHLNISWYF